MATIRVGFSSDFNVSGSKIGIGTANPTSLLEVSGTAKGDLNISGVSTLTAYSGFIAQNQRITKEHNVGYSTAGVGTFIQYYEVETGFTELGGVHHGDDQYYNTLSEDLVVEEGQIFSINNTEMVGVTAIGEHDPHTHASHVCAGSLEEVSVTSHFSVPDGGIDERPEIAIEGTVRFNTDLNTLEFFNGHEWRQFTYNQGQSGRAIYAGGGRSPSPGATDHIEYITLPTLGNSINFGNLRQDERLFRGGSSETRGVFSPGGLNPTNMEYITLASGGESIQFDGSMPNGRQLTSVLSSSTRGIIGGGYDAPAVKNHITYFEIAQLGTATDFGDLSQVKYGMGGMASPTRGIFAGGYTSGALASGMDYITIASKGNGIDFGDPTIGHAYPADGSDGVRGIIAGGVGNFPSGQTPNNVIDYVNIGSLGNAVNFGNLTKGKRHCSGASSKTRMVAFSGSKTVPSPDAYSVTDIDYIQISAGGAAQEFGELSVATYGSAGCSDSHGGLGGF